MLKVHDTNLLFYRGIATELAQRAKSVKTKLIVQLDRLGPPICQKNHCISHATCDTWYVEGGEHFIKISSP